MARAKNYSRRGRGRGGKATADVESNVEENAGNENGAMESAESSFQENPVEDAESTVQPDESESTGQLNEDSEFTTHPEDSEFTTHPKDSEFTTHPEDSEFTAQSEDSEFIAQPDVVAAEVEETHFSEAYEKLVEKGLTKHVAEEVDKLLLQTSVLSLEELDDKCLEALRDFPEDNITHSLQEFAESDFSSITVGKSTHLASILMALKEGGVEASKDSEKQTPQFGPSEEKIKELLERTGYKHEVTAGQRHYGPPPGEETVSRAPGHQGEIFIGKLPRDIYEDELVPLLEECGVIYDMRIMIDPNWGHNRGFAFVNFTTKEAAQAAVNKLNDFEIRPGKHLKVNISTPNLRLFVGNIPKNKTKEELMTEFTKLTENLSDVIVYSVADDQQKKNRGFCFLEYDTHQSAQNAKRKLGRPGFRIFNCEILVDWADPVDEPDNDTMSKVKVLYVKNLTTEITEEMLREHFCKHGTVERVKKVKDYGFVHFEDRSGAIKAMEELHNKTIGNATLDISLARPVSEKTKQRKEERKYGGWNSGGGGGWGGSPRGGGWGQRGMGGMRGSGGANVRMGGATGGGMHRGGGGSSAGGWGAPWGSPGGWGGSMMGPVRAPYGVPDYGYGGMGMGGGYGQPYGGFSVRGGFGAPMMGPRGGGFNGAGPRGSGRGGGRGNRNRGGGNRGGNRGGRGGGQKRKADDGIASGDAESGIEGQEAKAAKVAIDGADWSAHPIAQQPLEGDVGSESAEKNCVSEWTSDSFAGGWS